MTQLTNFSHRPPPANARAFDAEPPRSLRMTRQGGVVSGRNLQDLPTDVLAKIADLLPDEALRRVGEVNRACRAFVGPMWQRRWEALQRVDPTLRQQPGQSARTAYLRWAASSNYPASLSRLLRGHRNRVRAVALAGNTVLTGSLDGTARLWDAASGQLRHHLVGLAMYEVQTVALAGNVALTAGLFGPEYALRCAMCFWDVTSGQLLHSFMPQAAEWCMQVALTLTANSLVAGFPHGEVHLWNVASETPLHILVGHRGAVGAVALRGNRLVSGSHDGTARLWNATTGQLQHSFEAHTAEVSAVALSGNTVVTGSLDCTICLWNATSGQLLLTLVCPATVVAVELTGKTLAASFYDCTVSLWNVTSGALLQTLPEQANRVRALALAGNRLATVWGEWDAKVWVFQPAAYPMAYHSSAPYVDDSPCCCLSLCSPEPTQASVESYAKCCVNMLEWAHWCCIG